MDVHRVPNGLMLFNAFIVMNLLNGVVPVLRGKQITLTLLYMKIFYLSWWPAWPATGVVHSWKSWIICLTEVIFPEYQCDFRYRASPNSMQVHVRHMNETFWRWTIPFFFFFFYLPKKAFKTKKWVHEYTMLGNSRWWDARRKVLGYVQIYGELTML